MATLQEQIEKVKTKINMKRDMSQREKCYLKQELSNHIDHVQGVKDDVENQIALQKVDLKAQRE